MVRKSNFSLSAIVTVVDEDKVEPLLKALRALDLEKEQLGLRAFVWNVEDYI